ncbi:MAG TPA: nucleotidyltransferase [Actinomycetes bacterium]|nr:nucleotidyltransferase [Actinomycetes bacterium]
MPGCDGARALDNGGEHAHPEASFLEVLGEAITAVEAAEVPYLVIGGVASAALGRPRWTHDIDVFVRPQDADRSLVAMEEAGFAIERTDPHWLFKATRGGLVVDVIFKSSGAIYLDGEMLRRGIDGDFHGVGFRVASPEDLVVIKAIVDSERRPHHWHDALGLIASCELDWDYVVRRSRHGARRVLSLLAYAQSDDLVVPDAAMRALFDMIYGGAG